MKHRIAVAAITAGALIAGACADADREHSSLATEPERQGGVHYYTRGAATVIDPRTGKAVAVKPVESSVGPSASIVSASVTGEALQFAPTAPGLGTMTGTGTVSFVDQANRHHMLAFLYGKIGGPPVAMQHYVEGELISTSAYTWQRTQTGWVRTRSQLNAVRGGALYGTYVTTSTLARGPGGAGGGGGPAQPVRFEHRPAATPLQQMLGTVAYGLAFSLAPQSANAQARLFVTTCLPDMLRYATAAALVTGIAAAIAEAPFLTPVLVSQMIGALAGLALTEDLVLDCVVGHFQFMGMRGIGSGAGRNKPPPAECMVGSYAPQCSTPFTL